MSLTIRLATHDDLSRIVSLLQQLSIDVPREDLSMPLAMHYERAFDAIARDERQTLLVAESDGFVAGTATVVVVANLSHIGRPYAIVENVVVDASFRGKGIGDAMLNHATEIARNAGCYKVALTSNKSRVDAHRFYERVGFTASHEGFRLDL